MHMWGRSRTEQEEESLDLFLSDSGNVKILVVRSGHNRNKGMPSLATVLPGHIHTQSEFIKL